MNKVVLIGRLCAAPELKSTSSGGYLTGFTLAVDRFSGGEKTADFIQCRAFGRMAENIARLFGKGSLIAICGNLHQRSWEHEGERRYATEVNVDEFDFVGDKREPEQQFKADNADYIGELYDEL